ncbi:MAG: hypothetical protein K8W52_07220 [Deltaproteobacteria bacterium]|nr:hypothetical protein [Deltaproteobacteria bacterium]
MSADIEMRWIDAWSELIELAATMRDPTCLLPDGRVVDVEAGKAWLQDAVYDGARVGVQLALGRVPRIALTRRAR